MCSYNNNLEKEYLEQIAPDERDKFVNLTNEEQKEILSDYEEREKHKNNLVTFEHLGIYNPSPQLIKAYDNLKLSLNYTKISETIEESGMPLKEQETARELKTQTKQNYILISQIERLISQNEEIIQLLKKIEEK